MTKNQIHEWHERMEDGRKLYYRGHWNSREWVFRIAHPDGEAWQSAEPTPEIWVALRDVLFRKYQRKRVPFKFLENVDAILRELGVDPQDSGND